MKCDFLVTSREIAYNGCVRLNYHPIYYYYVITFTKRLVISVSSTSFCKHTILLNLSPGKRIWYSGVSREDFLILLFIVCLTDSNQVYFFYANKMLIKCIILFHCFTLMRLRDTTC